MARSFVPQQFRLVMANDAAIVRDCQIAWIQGNRIGLAFVNAPQRLDAKPKLAAPAIP